MAGATAAIDAVALAESARGGEPDRYLAALLAPRAAQNGLLAIAAFAAEMARIPAEVRDPMLAQIRLQWWREAVESAKPGARSGHPVADALAGGMAAHGLPPATILAMIDAREAALERDLFPDEADLDRHLDATEGNAFRLAWRVLTGSDPPVTIQRAMMQAGVAYGLARALTRLPAGLDRGGFVLPHNRLSSAGIDPGHLIARPPAEATVAAVDMLARGLEVRARAALAEVRNASRLVPQAAMPAFLPLALVEPYLDAQNVSGFRRLEQVAEISPLKRAWRLLVAQWRQRF